MYVRMYICMYVRVFMYVCMYVRMYVHMHACMYNKDTHTHMCNYTGKLTSVSTFSSSPLDVLILVIASNFVSNSATVITTTQHTHTYYICTTTAHDQNCN